MTCQRPVQCYGEPEPHRLDHRPTGIVTPSQSGSRLAGTGPWALRLPHDSAGVDRRDFESHGPAAAQSRWQRPEAGTPRPGAGSIHWQLRVGLRIVNLNDSDLLRSACDVGTVSGCSGSVHSKSHGTNFSESQAAHWH